MIINYIKELLKKYRKGLSIERLEKMLIKKNYKGKITDILKKSEIFTLTNGVVFLKSTLLKSKQDFFKEFDDFLQSKVNDQNLRESLINNYILSIPEIFFIKWLNISLERKLLVFNLLYNMIFKPDTIKDKLRQYFHELIEFYSVLIIYTFMLIKTYDNDINNQMKIIERIEIYEEILKKQLFNVLSIPDNVKTKNLQIEEEFHNAEKRLQAIIRKSFNTVKKYSSKLIKRIINNELKEFNFLSLLSRFEYSSYYEWITSLMDEKIKLHHNLFDDLGF